MLGFKKVVLVLFFSLSLLIFQVCTDCPTPIPPNESDSDIIFSGKTLNGMKPGIFTVNEDGSSLLENVENAVLYSSISIEKTIVYWSERDNGQDSLTKKVFYEKNGSPLIEAGTFPEIRYPIMSPDGKHIAFFSGQNELVIGSGGSIWIPKVYDICPNTLPVFSPDSKYLAFLEGDSIEAPLRINIVSSDNPGTMIDSKELAFGIIGLRGEAMLDWTHQDMIAYSVSTREFLDSIGFWYWENPTNSFTIKVEKEGAINPRLSPDRSKVLITDRRGDLYMSNFSRDSLEISWVQLTNLTDLEYILYPSWSEDGKKILYSKFFKNNSDKFSANLEIFDIKTEKTKVVCNNVYRGFWRLKNK